MARMRSSVRVAMTCRVCPCVALIDGAAGGLAERHDVNRAQAEWDGNAGTGGQGAIPGGGHADMVMLAPVESFSVILSVLYRVDFNILVKYH